MLRGRRSSFYASQTKSGIIKYKHKRDNNFVTQVYVIIVIMSFTKNIEQNDELNVTQINVNVDSYFI